MIARDVSGAPRIRVLADYGECPSHAIVAGFWFVGVEFGVDAPPNELGDRHAEPFRATFDVTMLRWLELYLYTHHDGTMIPSCGSVEPDP